MPTSTRRKRANHATITNHASSGPNTTPSAITPMVDVTPTMMAKEWDMAPTPPTLLEETQNICGLSLLVNDNLVPNTPPHAPRYRHVIPEKRHEVTKHLFTPSKSIANGVTSKSPILFENSIILQEKTEENEANDPLSKIEKLRRRLSLLKSQIKQSTQLLSEGNNLLSPNRNIPRVSPKKTLHIFHSSYENFPKKQDDDTFLLGQPISTPPKTKPCLQPKENSIDDTILASTPSRKMSTLTLTCKKSPISTTRISTPSFNNVTMPKKRKIDGQVSTPKTPKNVQTSSPKNILNGATPITSNKESTFHSSKRKSPQERLNFEDIFTPTPKKMKKTCDMNESFSLDLFKTPTPVKPKNPTSIKINGNIRRSLSLAYEETMGKNIFEEEEDDFVFKERKKNHKRS